jgi:hypothetical protein
MSTAIQCTNLGIAHAELRAAVDLVVCGADAADPLRTGAGQPVSP